MINGFGENQDPYAAGWEKGYLDALSDVAAEVHRLNDVTSRSRLQQLLVRLRFLVTGAER